MKTDKISVSSQGARMGAALEQADKVAAYKGLSAKNALHLRLLAEEMLGMMRSIAGEADGEFWISGSLRSERKDLCESRDFNAILKGLAAPAKGSNPSLHAPAPF